MSSHAGRRLASSRAFLLTAGALLAIPLAVAAQTVTGTIQGTVTDTQEGALPGVSIAIRNLETGHARDVVTNEKGFYSAPFLPIGRYRVTAVLSGFGTVNRDAISVELNRTSVVDFRLDPSVTEAITVSGQAPIINKVNAEIKGSLTAEQIAEKPIAPVAGPNSFLTLAEIFTGYQENPTSGQNNPTASSGSSLNFNGTGTRGATFQINGVANNDSSENQHRQGVALSTIKEFQVITNNYSAEFGGGYGSVVLVQTKSGTNDVHGDAYAYHTDSAWNERNYFSRSLPKPDNRRSQYGVTAGFPFLRDHLFGYASFDQVENDGERVYTRDVFLPSELAAARLTRGNDTPENRAFIADILARFPSSAVPNDPRSNRTHVTTQHFDFPDKDYSARLDFDPLAAHHFTARYQYTAQRRDAEDIIIGEVANQNHKQQNWGLTYTHVFSSRTVGEFRYGLGLRDTNVDVAAGNDTPIVRFTGSPVATSTIGNAGNFPIHRDQQDNQFVYNLSTLLGSSHYVKVGTDVRLQELDDLAQSNSRGSWEFRAGCGGTTYSSPYAAFLDGCVFSYTQAWGPFFLENRINEYNLYAEDNWQPFDNLTLNLGIRYEYVEAPEEAEGRIDYGFEDDDDNWEPRVGFAWTPSWDTGFLGAVTGGKGNMSIRGGYGIYHGRVFQSIFSQTGNSLRTNPPHALSQTYTTLPNLLNVADPTLGFVFTPGPQTARHSITIADPELEMPYKREWSVSVERVAPWNSAVRVTYTGNEGVGFIRYRLDNLPVPPYEGGPYVVAADALCAGTGTSAALPVNATCPVAVPIAPNEISQRVPRTNERRPDARYGTNFVISNDAETEYHGLQLEWIKRFSEGLQFQMSYTHSTTRDNVSEATFVGAGDTNSTGPNREFAWGYSRFHTPHRFTFNLSYRLPFFKDRRDFLGIALGGWRFATTVKWAHGTPFTVIDTGVGDINFDGYSENRPVLVDRSIEGRTVDNPGNSADRIPRNAFRRAVPGDPVEDLTERNSFYGDEIKNVDVALSKGFPMPWGHELIFRLDVFNLFNNVQFAFPQTDMANVNFGRITATLNTPRTIQAGLRYVF